MGKKILIIGHARHGKDTLAEILNEHFGLTFKSSSQMANEIFIFEKLRGKYGYKTLDDSFNDRINHRAEWHELIVEYNKEDPARLAKEIISVVDIYVGMRSQLELDECLKINLFDLVIWVDASERLPHESNTSIKIDKSSAHIIMLNNVTRESFVKKAIMFGKCINL